MDFDAAVAELDQLVQTLEAEGDERALYLLDLIDAVHRPAIEALAAGRLEGPAARAVLAMYDLAEVDERTLAEEALDDVRGYVASHGGSVELLDVADGVVRVRMGGSCVGCAASEMTLRRGIEEALRSRLPGFREVVAEQAEPSPPTGGGLIQIEDLRRPSFEALNEVPRDGELRAAEVSGVPLLLCGVEGETFAFRDRCPSCDRELAGGRLSDRVLVCPWSNCAYDARTGRRADDAEAEGLAVVPVAVEDGRVKVAVNVA